MVAACLMPKLAYLLQTLFFLVIFLRFFFHLHSFGRSFCQPISYDSAIISSTKTSSASLAMSLCASVSLSGPLRVHLSGWRNDHSDMTAPAPLCMHAPAIIHCIATKPGGRKGKSARHALFSVRLGSCSGRPGSFFLCHPSLIHVSDERKPRKIRVREKGAVENVKVPNSAERSG